MGPKHPLILPHLVFILNCLTFTLKEVSHPTGYIVSTVSVKEKTHQGITECSLCLSDKSYNEWPKFWPTFYSVCIYTNTNYRPYTYHAGLGLWRQKPVFYRDVGKNCQKLVYDSFFHQKLSETGRNLSKQYFSHKPVCPDFLVQWPFLIILESLWKENKHTLYL